MNSSFSISSRTVAWTIWMIASIFYAYQYILRVMPNILISDIMQRFSIDAATFGQFSGVYYIGYSLMHLPLGIMLDRFGPKKIMSASILLIVAGLLPLIFADHWIYPIFGRVLIGMGSAAAILGVFKSIRMGFKADRFPRRLSFSVTIGLIGAIYGGGPVDYILNKFGYDTVIYLFAIAGIIFAGITYCLIPDVKAISRNTVASDIREVFKNSKVICTCICSGLMMGPLEGFADVWGTSFLKTIGSLDSSVAAGLPSIIYIGMCFGSLVLNFIAEKVGNYLLVIIGAGVTMIMGFLLLLTGPWTPGVLTLNFVLIGICSAYQILAVYKASSFVRAEIVGLATAAANMISMIFGYLFHSVIGYLVNAMGGANHPVGLLYGVGVVPVALILGVFGFIILFFQEQKDIKKLEKKI